MADYEVIGSNPVKDYEVMGSNPISNVKPMFSLNTTVMPQMNTITPQDIVTSMLPFKASNIIAEQISNRANKVIPSIPMSKNLLPPIKSMGDIGFNFGTQNIGNPILRNILFNPLTYIPAGGTEKGQQLLTQGKSAMSKKLEPVISEVSKAGIFKQGRDYLYNKIAKPAADFVSEHIKNFPESAQKSLKLKDETVSLLKQHGYDKVADINGAEELAKDAFNNAMKQKTKYPNDTINVKDTLDRLIKLRRSLKGSDTRGIDAAISRLKILQPAPQGFIAEGGRGTGIVTKRIYQRILNGENLANIGKEVRISKSAFSGLRNDLNNLRGGGYDNQVLDVMDSLYNDAEKAGLQGMQNARELFSQFKQFDKVKTNLANVEKITAEKLHSALLKVVKDPKQYQVMVDKYSPYMGIDKAHKLFQQALSVRHGGQAIKGAIAVGALGVGGHRIMSILR